MNDQPQITINITTKENQSLQFDSGIFMDADESKNSIIS